ncbi:Epithelial sodium channel, partial [Cinara cedri]
MIESNVNHIIIRRRMGILNGKKLNIKPIGIGDGNYLRTFTNATSLHGVIYIGEPKRPYLERIFWICVMSSVFLICGYQIHQLLNSWMESQIITTLSESNKYSLSASDYVPFPGITICSDLQLQYLEKKKTIVNQTLHNEYEDGINLLCHIYEPNLAVNQKFINPNSWNLLINEHRIFCKQRVVSISWTQENIDIPCQYFQPIYTNYGICYSMNMIPFNQLLSNDYNLVLSKLTHPKSDIITKANETMWNPEIGFSKNAKPFHIPWKVIGDTIEDSVTIKFNLKKENTGIHCPITDTGMTLFLHTPNDVPVSIQPTAYISVNSVIYVTTTFTIRKSSENLSGWKPEIRHCYYQHERTLKFFKMYTISNCDIECKANHSLKMCGCVAFYHPRDMKTPICGSASYRCMRQYSNNGYSILNKQLINLNTTNDCNCLETCTHIRYQHNVVYTHRNLTNNVIQPDKQNEVSSILVMYYKRQIWSVQRTALISGNELLGNIGGSLGLFLGASIISVFEVIYFFAIRLFVDRWNKI